MKTGRSTEKALLITDACGQIIDRIGICWADLAQGVKFEVVRSSEVSPADCCRLATEAGLVHWLDFRRFCQVGKAMTVPQTVTVHHIVESELAIALKSLRHADAITATSRRWQTRLQERTQREVRLIPYAIDVSAFPARPPRQHASSSKAPWVLGFAGKGKANLDDRKGTALLLDILKTVRQHGTAVELLLVGPDWDELAAKVTALGIQVRRAQFHSTEETAAAYAQMDALIVTASEEGGPVTILEAMSSGVPVITSDVGHVPEVVQHGKTGMVCPNRTVAEYVSAMETIRTRSDLATSIALEGRAFVERHRDERKVIPKIDFKSLFDEARRHFATLTRSELARRRANQALKSMRQVAGRVLKRKTNAGRKTP